MFASILLLLLIFAVLDLTVFAIFDMISAITIPVTCFIFPFLIYFRLIRNNYFEKHKILHYTLCFVLIAIGIFVWIYSIMSLYYVRYSNKNI